MPLEQFKQNWVQGDRMSAHFASRVGSAVQRTGYGHGVNRDQIERDSFAASVPEPQVDVGLATITNEKINDDDSPTSGMYLAKWRNWVPNFFIDFEPNESFEFVVDCRGINFGPNVFGFHTERTPVLHVGDCIPVFWMETRAAYVPASMPTFRLFRSLYDKPPGTAVKAKHIRFDGNGYNDLRHETKVYDPLFLGCVFAGETFPAALTAQGRYEIVAPVGLYRKARIGTAFVQSGAAGQEELWGGTVALMGNGIQALEVPARCDWTYFRRWNATQLHTGCEVYVKYFRDENQWIILPPLTCQARYVLFTLTKSFTTTQQFIPGNTVDRYWDGDDPGANVVLENFPKQAAGQYIWEGEIGDTGMAVLLDRDNTYLIIQMDRPVVEIEDYDIWLGKDANDKIYHKQPGSDRYGVDEVNNKADLNAHHLLGSCLGPSWRGFGLDDGGHVIGGFCCGGGWSSPWGIAEPPWDTILP